MAKHTPGKWKAVHRHSDGKATDDEMAGLGWDIEGPPEASNRGQFERAADAHLVAAAPDMYAALLSVIEALEWVATPGGTQVNVALNAARYEINSIERATKGQGDG